MKYCPNCGTQVNENQEVCLHCGKLIQPKQVSNQATNTNQKSTNPAVYAVVSFLFPIIGAILYYSLKNTDPKGAKVANLWAWLGFIAILLLYLLRVYL